MSDFACWRSAAAGFRPNYKADEEDQKFLEHVNSKIRMQPRDADGGDCPAGRDPKALSTPLAQETFERLIETFEILLARTKAHQVRAGNRLASVAIWTGRLPGLPLLACVMPPDVWHLVAVSHKHREPRSPGGLT